MKIDNNTVASFHYDLADAAGNRIESSRGGQPLAVLHGAGNVIPGVEAALAGRSVGERFSVTVPPEQGYGERREGLTQRVPKKYFRDGQRLRAGDTTMLSTLDGQRVVTVVKVGQSVIDVDLNHPMAGRTLVFDIEVVAVREATAEEIAHGHAHEPGGHAH
ncbi:MAG: peptidylprolyl isomerase [Xanthomonadaceae bacterium]|jgi:FKBP-type peptidyl-prolyl cis-trans isomerase SlyD|nr:peptidylprolyl isomerase [Xanthomonadaceae bacterium]